MGKKEFDDFIKKQKIASESEKEIDWEANKEEWLKRLDDFYLIIEEYLKEYVAEDKVKYSYSNIEITETYIGSYIAKTLNIDLGKHKVELKPIGTTLIGAKGRVDLIGANGKVKFVLVNKDLSAPRIKFEIYIQGEEPAKKEEEPEILEWDWKIATPPPRISYINLEQETFLDALMEVVGA